MTERREKIAVLIVDDEPAACQLAREMFASFGLECFEASNGRDALSILSAHPEIALLFSDVRMPGMSGQELAAKALTIRPGLGLLLTSGWVGMTSVGETPFLSKPYRMNDLRAVVQSLLSRSTTAGGGRTTEELPENGDCVGDEPHPVKTALPPKIRRSAKSATSSDRG